MLHGLLGRNNFYTKCKATLKKTKLRLEMIKKKRNAMQMFLKKDIAFLLRSNHHYNACGRAEGLYLELNLSSCYDYVEECCACVMDHLKVMCDESECPEECRVAVASLLYSASRFADLPELRDLRHIIIDKYGNALDPFVNKEYVHKLSSNPPTMDTKVRLIRLIKDVANEFAIAWDSSLEQQLYKNSCVPQEEKLEQNLHQNDASSDASISEEQGISKTNLMGRRSSMKLGSDESEVVKDTFGRDYQDGTSKESNTRNHVHPKLPDYDELTSRMGALKNGSMSS